MSENARLIREIRSSYDVLSLDAGHSDRFENFFRGLKDTREKNRIAVMLKIVSEQGTKHYIASGDSKHLEDRLYELRPTGIIRFLYCFHRGNHNVVVLTHCFRGKRGKGKCPRRQIDRGKEFVVVIDGLEIPD